MWWCWHSIKQIYCCPSYLNMMVPYSMYTSSWKDWRWSAGATEMLHTKDICPRRYFCSGGCMEFMLDWSHPVLPITSYNLGSISHTGLFSGRLTFSCYISEVSYYQSLLLLLPFQCHHNHHQEAIYPTYTMDWHMSQKRLIFCSWNKMK